MKTKTSYLLLIILFCYKSAFADISLDNEEMVLFITPYFIAFASILFFLAGCIRLFIFKSTVNPKVVSIPTLFCCIGILIINLTIWINEFGKVDFELIQNDHEMVDHLGLSLIIIFITTLTSLFTHWFKYRFKKISR